MDCTGLYLAELDCLGSAGLQLGVIGVTGMTGLTGLMGLTGLTGLTGVTWRRGDGFDEVMGLMGVTGLKGMTGASKEGEGEGGGEEKGEGKGNVTPMTEDVRTESGKESSILGDQLPQFDCVNFV